MSRQNGTLSSLTTTSIGPADITPAPAVQRGRPRTSPPIAKPTHCPNGHTLIRGRCYTCKPGGITGKALNVPEPPKEDRPSAQLNRAIGLKIRDARYAKDMTQTALAEVAGISQPIISDIELGRYKCSMTNLSKIAKALGLNPSDLIDVVPLPALVTPPIGTGSPVVSLKPTFPPLSTDANGLIIPMTAAEADARHAALCRAMDAADAPDPELTAIAAILTTLETLDTIAAGRVLEYVAQRRGTR